MNYYNEIKKELINNELYKRVKDYSKNKSDLNTYYNVGRLLFEAGKHYGEGIIKKYSLRLIKEIDKKYSVRNLYNMRLFYVKFFNNEKVNTMCSQLTWSHYRELLWLKNLSKIDYYIEICIEQTLSVRELRNKIKNNEYERLDDQTKKKLITKEENKIEDFIKNPILIKNSNNYNEMSEKLLKQLILEDLNNFLKELGNGFSFIETEYKIKLGDRYNYIDLLLFNYVYNSFVVVELKITELKAEYIGQIKKYMNYIDRNVKTINQNRTIGIIICRKDNKFVMQYCSDERIFRSTYILY
jgi:predicted nuclease of restriction endonuclease-like (RecB) superfamily